MADGTERSQAGSKITRFIISDNYIGLSEKLCHIAKDLHSHSLMSQIKILDKLIYKYKNQHSREKYFQGLKKMKKSLNRLKMLSLDQELIAISKTICDADVSSALHLEDVLTEVMHSGKLVIKNIVLCQETIQYTLSYLSLGFFVAFHVTLIALISRIWVLLKDCWCNLVECYQLVRLFGQHEIHQNSSNNLPECLTLWLHKDLKDVYNVDTNVDTKISCSGSDTIAILEKLLGKVNSSEKEMLTDSMTNDGSLDNYGVDLGEPVEDPSGTKRFEHYNATPPGSHRVSDVKKSLALKFDLEHVGRRKDFTNGAKIKRTPENLRNRDVSLRLPGGRIQHGVRDRKMSFNRQVFPCRRRLLHRVAHLIFTKEQSFRYTLRTLAATNVYRGMALRNVRGLLVVVKYSLRSELLSPARKILQKAKRLLQCELRSREFEKNEQVVQANTIPVSLNLGKQNGAGRDQEIDVSCVSKTTARRVTKVKLSATTSRCTEQKNTNAGRNLSKDLPHTKSLLLHVEQQDSGFMKRSDSKRDEIDDIFCSVGL